MADEEENGEQESGGKKFDPEKIKALIQNINWKDKKVRAIAVGVVVVLVALVGMSFLGDSEPEKKDTSVDWEDIQRPVDYILVYGADPKETELRATIKDEERVMQFSMSLGVEQKSLRLELQKRMAPLVSEILRFMSKKTKDEILEMIQDEDAKEKEKLLLRLNLVLKNAGEERLDLRKSGRIVQVNFLKYYFPTI